ncbi:hypothetical protein BDI4_690013 [Burkholderia diffusa]|nr:hypothetical protein BDI4_690013 [Burkholderia diffusa]
MGHRVVVDGLHRAARAVLSRADVHHVLYAALPARSVRSRLFPGRHPVHELLVSRASPKRGHVGLPGGDPAEPDAGQCHFRLADGADARLVRHERLAMDAAARRPAVDRGGVHRAGLPRRWPAVGEVAVCRGKGGAVAQPRIRGRAQVAWRGCRVAQPARLAADLHPAHLQYRLLRAGLLAAVDHSRVGRAQPDAYRSADCRSVSDGHLCDGVERGALAQDRRTPAARRDSRADRRRRPDHERGLRTERGAVDPVSDHRHVRHPGADADLLDLSGADTVRHGRGRRHCTDQLGGQSVRLHGFDDHGHRKGNDRQHQQRNLRAGRLPAGQLRADHVDSARRAVSPGREVGSWLSVVSRENQARASSQFRTSRATCFRRSIITICPSPGSA